MATLKGSEGNDSITGTNSNDTINGRGGDDVIYGMGGDDFIIGGTGSDDIFGGEGNDLVFIFDFNLSPESWGINDNRIISDINVDLGGGNDIVWLSPSFISGAVTGGGGFDVLRVSSIFSIGVDFSVFSGFELIDFSSNGFNYSPYTDAALWNSFELPGYGSPAYSDGLNYRILTETNFADLSQNLIIKSSYGLLLSAGEISTSHGIDFFREAGGDGNSHLIGTDQDDRYYGNQSVDFFTGNGGDDYFDGGDGIDTAIYNGNYADYKVSEITYNTFSVRDNVGSDGTDTIIDVNKLQFADQIIDVVIRGMEIIGDDSDEEIAGGSFADRVDGAGGDDVLNGGGGNDIVDGGDGNDIVKGDSGNDFLNGGIGTDILNGGTGDDEIDGGDGVDTVTYSTLNVDLVINLTTGTASGDGTDTIKNVENVVGGKADDTIIGSSEDNSLTGGSGNDNLNGAGGDDVLYAGDGDDTVNGGSGSDLIIGGNGKGNDTYNGGSGVDTVKYTSATAGIAINLTGGTAKATAGGDQANIGFDVLVSIENVIAGNYADLVIGSSAANKLEGMNGDDTLDGGDGDDTIDGGSGNDKVYGGKGNDKIDLGSGNDYVKAGGGKESFIGGSGTDYISYYDSTGGVTVNLATNKMSGSWAGNDTISGFESISGSKNGADTITGTSGANTIKTYGGNDKVYGGKGNDKIDLGSGNDYVKAGGGKESFIGGSGTDYISYYDSTGGVTVNLATNKMSGSWAGNDTISGFESISGSKTGADTITGTSGANTIKTYGGNDKVYGGKGNDSLYMDAGNDTLDGGSGTDWLYVTGSTNSVVNLAKTTGQNTGYGTDIIKNIENASGGTGVDKFYGTGGNNTLKGNNGNDLLYGQNGHDSLYGGNNNDKLYGGSGNDTLKGDAGRDVLQGDAGKDFLYGGADADTFVFRKTSDSSASASSADVIYDFKHGVDKIDLHYIDASTKLSGNNTFIFDGTTKFGTSNQGDIYYKQFNNAGTSNDYTMVYIDTDNDSGTEMSIKLMGLHNLTVDDFIL